MSAASSQSEFAAALLDPAATLPAGVTTMRGSADAARFDVYRNNVMVSLITALEQKFPVSRKLVGDAFFKQMARGFIRQERPRSPLIFQYGDGFPEFIDDLETTRGVPYLGDVARLEVLWMRAYHAADATPLDIAAIAGTDPEILVGSGIVPMPSASLLRSDWPVGSIWAAHQQDPVASVAHSGPETILVLRPQADVRVHIVPPQDGNFAATLFAGKSLGGAAQAASHDASFDFGSALVGLVSLGTVLRLQPISEGDNS